MLEIINKTKFYNIEELRSLSEEEILERVAAADVPSLEDGIKPFMVITGLPGSGKSYFGAKLSERYGKEVVSTDSYFLSMRKAWLEGKSHPYIDLFCRKYEREIVENSLDITKSDSFTRAGMADIFKELEMGLFLYHLYNGDFAEKILDLGGSTMLQPAVIKSLSDTNTFNLEIPKERRVENLLKDFMEKPNKRKTCIFKVMDIAEKAIFNATGDDGYSEIPGVTNPESFRVKLSEMRADYGERQDRFGDVERKLEHILRLSVAKYDDGQSFRFKFFRLAKHTVSSFDEALEIIEPSRAVSKNCGMASYR